MNINEQILYQRPEKWGKKELQMQAVATSCIQFGGGHLQAAPPCCVSARNTRQIKNDESKNT